MKKDTRNNDNEKFREFLKEYEFPDVRNIYKFLECFRDTVLLNYYSYEEKVRLLNDLFEMLYGVREKFSIIDIEGVNIFVDEPVAETTPAYDYVDDVVTAYGKIIAKAQFEDSELFLDLIKHTFIVDLSGLKFRRTYYFIRALNDFVCVYLPFTVKLNIVFLRDDFKAQIKEQYGLEEGSIDYADADAVARQLFDKIVSIVAKLK